MLLRGAVRRLLASPWFLATSIGVIAITVASSATVFAVVDGVLFKRLPFTDADRLHLLTGLDASGESGALSARDVRILADAGAGVMITPVASSILALRPDSPATNLYAGEVSSDFFDVTGIRPLIGGFLPEHFVATPQPGSARPVLIAYRWWERWLEGRPEAIGQVLDLPGARVQVVGVLPPDFVFPRSSPNEITVLVPYVVTPAAAGDRWARNVSAAVVRVPEGVNLHAAKMALDAALAAHVAEYSEAGGTSAERYVATRMVPVSSALSTLQQPLFQVVFSVTLLLVVLGAFNVTALMVSRAGERSREFRVYTALGARNIDLSTLWLWELLLVAILGAAVGLILAYWSLPSVLALVPVTTPLLTQPAIDSRAMTFALAAAVVPLLLASTVPMLTLVRRAARIPLSAPPTVARSPRPWGRSGLLAVEAAVGCISVVAGSLVLAGFLLLRSEDPGFDSGRLAIIELARIPGERSEARTDREIQAFERLKQVPGVKAVAVVGVPLLERMLFPSRFQPPPSGRSFRSVHEIPVAGPFFEIAGLRLLQGRLPTADELSRDSVAVVSELVARAYWPDAPAVGQSLAAGTVSVTVVGVVETAQIGSQWRQQFGQIYVPARLGSTRRAVFLIQTDSRPGAVAETAAAAVRRDVPGVLVRRAASMDWALLASEPIQRFSATVFALALAVTLALFTVGVFGLIAMDVRQREREVGIRTALGASMQQVIASLVWSPLRPVLVGVGAGLAVSWWTTRLVQHYLYRFDAHDPRVWLVAVLVLTGIALAAAWLPAHRAARVDPLVALKTD